MVTKSGRIQTRRRRDAAPKRHGWTFWLVNIFLTVSALILVFAAVFFCVVRFTGQANRLFLAGYKPYFQTLTTMEPEYEQYALVLIQQKPYAEVKPGDTIAMLHYNDRGELVPIFHRVIGYDEAVAGHVTKGDQREEADPFRTTEQ
jgi:hypothetical protein